jgi:hypothetical protein
MTAPDHRADMTVRFTNWEHIASAAGQTTTA